jgi:hypothetical protein
MAFDELLRHQLTHNPVYRTFYESFDHPEGLPLLPVEAFRETRVYAAGTHPPEIEFRSSGTTDMRRSVHHVAHAQVYRESIWKGMSLFYDVDAMIFAAYAPGYDQNPHSSLMWMLRELVEHSHPHSRFLTPGQPLDPAWLDAVRASGKTLMLFGAAFGLLDLAEKHPVALPESTILMETGGMKTYRREINRHDMHRILAEAFSLPLGQIHSEYGMTELLSQAYATGLSGFRTPPWLHVSIRDPKDPLREVPAGEEGLIGLIDEKNRHSCPFLLTGDRGRILPDGTFDVLGRYNPTQLRGCNFIMEEE